MTCEHFQNASPENEDCAWCVRHRINLDRNGRLCGRCRSDPAFRGALERQRVVRFGACAGLEAGDARASSAKTPEATSYCAVFGVATDEAQCERCRTDAEFRAFLRGQWLARRAAGNSANVDRRTGSQAGGGTTTGTDGAGRNGGPDGDARARRGETCARRGALLRHDVRNCCGGKERRIAVYACAEFAETHEGRCAECVGWRMKLVSP